MELPKARLERAKKVERAIASAFGNFGFYRVRLTYDNCRWDVRMEHPDFVAYAEIKERRDEYEQIIVKEGFLAEVSKVKALVAKAASHCSGGKPARAYYSCLLKGKVWTFKIAQGRKTFYHQWGEPREIEVNDSDGKPRKKWFYVIPMKHQTPDIPLFSLTEAEITRFDDENFPG